MELWINVLKEFGYYDSHCVGEKFKMPVIHVNDLIKKGYIEIVVNNIGNNLPYDEEDTISFIEIEFHKEGYVTTRKNKI